ncbi:YbeD family protein [Agaribacterium sp. ZY112]|uniref:YbeD family protein n=1 Tax=Agaribacterium sp. ZY112 TaxID=3233574 RepID=UPI00352349CD
MSQQEPPKIEFPCANYPVKIMGEHSEEYHETVLDIVEKHAPGFDRKRVSIKVSSKGSFRSITVLITATGEEQLHALHMDLKAVAATKMVL